MVSFIKGLADKATAEAVRRVVEPALLELVDWMDHRRMLMPKLTVERGGTRAVLQFERVDEAKPPTEQQ